MRKGWIIFVLCALAKKNTNTILPHKKNREYIHMVTSIILINTERSKINDVAEKLAEMEGISEVYSVSGKYDLIAIVRVKSNDDLADLVTNKLLVIDSIEKSETMLAFKVFSRHDLEAMFTIGM